MEINNVTNTVAWMRSMQYEMQQEEPDGEDTILQEVKTEALTQIRQRHGKGVYETVEDDPALAWSVKGQTYPSAVRVDRSV